MDGNFNFNLGESSPTSGFGNIRDGLAADNSPMLLRSATCALCHRILSSGSDNGTADLEPEAIYALCGDCKFLLHEDMDTTSPPQMRMSAASRRRYRHSSSESIDSTFSQQFSQMITNARQNHDNQSVDGEGAAMSVLQQSSSRTTPTGSRRFRRVFSDYDSDGFDSLYGDTESNVSFRRSRTFRSEADTISYSAYEGDSDASVDGHSILENEHFGHPNGDGSDLDTNTDIDPMQAGLYPWSSENEEEEVGEEEDDDSDWEEAHIERSPLDSVRSVTPFRGLSRLNTGNVHIYGRRQSLSPEVEGVFTFGGAHGERIQTHTDNLSAGLRELVARNHVGDSVDYLDARLFENLLEHLAETENSRKGAPPASVSFVNDLPCLTINEDKLDGIACAICKDPFSVGTVVKQLPCCHLYHPACIYPWLRARNTCPLCRYELPTDDCDYEARKRNRGDEYRMRQTHQRDVDEDRSLDATAAAAYDGESSPNTSARDIPRNGWLLAAAAPIVGILGVSLMLWFRTNRRCQRSHVFHRSQRRWWWLYF